MKHLLCRIDSRGSNPPRIKYAIVDPMISKCVRACPPDTIDSTSIRNSFRQLHFMQQKRNVENV